MPLFSSTRLEAASVFSLGYYSHRGVQQGLDKFHNLYAIVMYVLHLLTPIQHTQAFLVCPMIRWTSKYKLITVIWRGLPRDLDRCPFITYSTVSY
jgi:hypothetical protein